MPFNKTQFVDDLIKTKYHSGKTIRKMSEETAISRSTIEQIMKGRCPNITHFVELCKWMDKDVKNYI